MSRKPLPKNFDENPEWTKADFARAKRPEELLSRATLKNFKNFRGPQKTPTKVPVYVRLSPVVVEHFKSFGRDWRTRIDDALVKVAKAAKKKAG